MLNLHYINSISLACILNSLFYCGTCPVNSPYSLLNFLLLNGYGETTQHAISPTTDSGSAVPSRFSSLLCHHFMSSTSPTQYSSYFNPSPLPQALSLNKWPSFQLYRETPIDTNSFNFCSHFYILIFTGSHPSLLSSSFKWLFSCPKLMLVFMF